MGTSVNTICTQFHHPLGKARLHLTNMPLPFSNRPPLFFLQSKKNEKREKTTKRNQIMDDNWKKIPYFIYTMYPYPYSYIQFFPIIFGLLQPSLFEIRSDFRCLRWPHLSQWPFDTGAASAVFGALFGTSRRWQRPGSREGRRGLAAGGSPPWVLVKLMELLEVLAQRTPLAAWRPKMVLRFIQGIVWNKKSIWNQLLFLQLEKLQVAWWQNKHAVSSFFVSLFGRCTGQRNGPCHCAKFKWTWSSFSFIVMLSWTPEHAAKELQ